MAGTITGVLNRLTTQQGRPQMAEVVLTCTADAAAHTFPTTVVNTLAGLSGFDIRGLKLYSVKAIPSAITPPTNGTSVTITDKYGVDILDGAGVSFIPNTGTAWSTNALFPAFITGDITVTITGNLVDSAIVTLVLELIGN